MPDVIRLPCHAFLSRRCRNRAMRAALGLMFALAAGAAWPDEPEERHPFLERGFWLDVGVFFPERHIDLQVNGSIGEINAEFDFDEQLKLGNSDETFAAELSWRYRGNWSVVGQYFKSSDRNALILDEDIEWGDLVFGAGTGVTGATDFLLTRVFFGRHFEFRHDHDFGFGGGLHWLSISNEIEGTIIINDRPRTARRTVSAEAPLPNIGAWYLYSITPRWGLRSRLDLLSADVGHYDGLLVNASVGVNYRVTEHIGLGVNYNYFELDVGVDKSGWRGRIETIYDGVYVYATAFF